MLQLRMLCKQRGTDFGMVKLWTFEVACYGEKRFYHAAPALKAQVKHSNKAPDSLGN